MRRKMEMLPKMVENLGPDICATCTTRIFREYPRPPVEQWQADADDRAVERGS